MWPLHMLNTTFSNATAACIPSCKLAQSTHKDTAHQCHDPGSRWERKRGPVVNEFYLLASQKAWMVAVRAQ